MAAGRDHSRRRLTAFLSSGFLIEINPAGVSAMHRLTVDPGVGYARSSTVLDYRLAGQGSIDSNLERLAEWAGERSNDRAPRHDFGVLQPTDKANDAIVARRKRLQGQNAVAAWSQSSATSNAAKPGWPGCARSRRSYVHEVRRSRVLPAERRADADWR